MLDSVFIHDTSFVEKNCIIGENSKIWHFSNVLSGAKVGKNCTISQNVMIGKNVSIGDNCKIQNNVSVFEGVILEDNVFCGPSCVFTNILTPRAFISKKKEFVSTLVKKGATIGANSTIICGNIIGSYAMIGAGSVVTKDVQDFALVFGNPAKRIGWVSKAGERLSEHLICSKTKEKYYEEKGSLFLSNEN